jgi:hypothetical protein
VRRWVSLDFCISVSFSNQKSRNQADSPSSLRLFLHCFSLHILSLCRVSSGGGYSPFLKPSASTLIAIIGCVEGNSSRDEQEEGRRIESSEKVMGSDVRSLAWSSELLENT